MFIPAIAQKTEKVANPKDLEVMQLLGVGG
jgi:hypothetical protein